MAKAKSINIFWLISPQEEKEKESREWGQSQRNSRIYWHYICMHHLLLRAALWISTIVPIYRWDTGSEKYLLKATLYIGNRVGFELRSVRSKMLDLQSLLPPFCFVEPFYNLPHLSSFSASGHKINLYLANGRTDTGSGGPNAPNKGENCKGGPATPREQFCKGRRECHTSTLCLCKVVERGWLCVLLHLDSSSPHLWSWGNY